MAETTGKNTKSALEAAVSDDGSGLVLTRELARVLGEPHAGADGRHKDEPSPFHDGDPVGAVSAVCTVRTARSRSATPESSPTSTGTGPTTAGPTRPSTP